MLEIEIENERLRKIEIEKERLTRLEREKKREAKRRNIEREKRLKELLGKREREEEQERRRQERERIIRKTPVPNEINIGKIFRELRERGSIQHFKPLSPLDLEESPRDNTDKTDPKDDTRNHYKYPNSQGRNMEDVENDDLGGIFEVDIAAVIDSEQGGKGENAQKKVSIFDARRDKEESFNVSGMESFHLLETQILEKFKFAKDQKAGVEEQRKRGPVLKVEKSHLALGKILKGANRGNEERGYSNQDQRNLGDRSEDSEKDYLNQNTSNTHFIKKPKKQRREFQNSKERRQVSKPRSKQGLEIPPIKPNSKPPSSRRIITKVSKKAKRPKTSKPRPAVSGLEEAAEIFISLQPDKIQKSKPQISERKIPTKKRRSVRGNVKLMNLNNKEFKKRKKMDLAGLKANSRHLKTMGEAVAKRGGGGKMNETLPNDVKRNFDLKRLNKRIKNRELGKKKREASRKGRRATPGKKRRVKPGRKGAKKRRRPGSAKKSQKRVESVQKTRKAPREESNKQKKGKERNTNSNNTKYRKKFYVDETQELPAPKSKKASRCNSRKKLSRGGSKKKISRQQSKATSKAASRKSSKPKSIKKSSKPSSPRNIPLKSKQRKKRGRKLPSSRRLKPARDSRKRSKGKTNSGVSRNRVSKPVKAEGEGVEKVKKTERYRIMKEMYGDKAHGAEEPILKKRTEQTEDLEIDIEAMRNKSSFQDFRRLLQNLK